MADDVVTPLNPPVATVDKEELEEATLDETLFDEVAFNGTSFEVNVSQRSCEEEPSRRVVRTQVDRSAWDHRLSPNPHALTIYLDFVPARGFAPERFEECQCEDDDAMFVFIVELGFPMMATIVGCEAQSTPFP